MYLNMAMFQQFARRIAAQTSTTESGRRTHFILSILKRNQAEQT